jgi:TonB family protein
MVLKRSATAKRADPAPVIAFVPPPRLLIELEPRHEVFLRNLRDSIRPSKQVKLRLSSWPDKFWPDVFVERPLPWKSLARSYTGHIALIALLLVLFQIWPQSAKVVKAEPFSSKDVVYYSAADYLPPINTGVSQKRAQSKGDPVPAKQPILSVPKEADNHSQTIVTPPDLQLKRDTPLPNVVAWSNTSPAIPSAAISRTPFDSKISSLMSQVVAPAPTVHSDRTKPSANLDGAVVAPPPEMTSQATRRFSDLNIAHSEAVAPAPKLAISEQRTLSRGHPSLGNAAAVPPPPGTQGTTSGGNRQLIALGVNPLAPSASVAPPAGNRRGSFAAGPDGKPNASAKPGSANGNANTSIATGKHNNGIPSGLQVTSPDKNSTSLVADSRTPRVGDNTKPAVLADNPSALEQQVFHGRRSYSMKMNMPNLNSSGGSWVIHFAEMTEGTKGDLSAPVAVQKVDPGYPLELMRHNIGGNVTLYAVIGSDGSVGKVRVLQGIDDRLDEYAKNALARWRFQPALKNGAAVPLEAVVIIPFHPVRTQSNF